MTAPVVTRLSARATFHELAGDLVLMRLRGLVTADALAHFTDELVSMYGNTMAGWLVDFRGALLAISQGDFEELAKRPHPDSAKRPAAFVASADVEAELRLQSGRMAFRGHSRRTFTGAERAADWVRAKVASKD